MASSTRNDRSTRRFSDEAVEYLRTKATELQFDAGQTIVRRGERGRAFFVVLSGEVEVRLAASDGRTLPLTRLGEGATFGEMALLRDEPVSADVVAVSRTEVLSCPPPLFTAALAECEPLRSALLTRLASDLNHTTIEAWKFFQRAEALRLLIRCDTPAEPLISESARMRRVVREIEELASVADHVLITGAPGTGKLLVARALHEAGHDPSAPLIVVDCQRLEEGDARRLLLGSTGDRRENTAITGVGAVHLARGGTLILRHVDGLESDLQEELAQEVWQADGRSSASAHELRLIATLRGERNALNLDGRLSSDLLETLSGRLAIPAVSERRRDILPLARYFLEQLESDPAYELSQDAENTLVSMPCRHHNVAELREAVELAVQCTDGAEIRAEHLFSGPMTSTGPSGVDLGRLTILRDFLHGRGLDLIRGLVLASFMAAIVLCLVAATTPAGRVANGFVWVVWEPVVFALFLLAGSVWCTVCPLSFAGRLAQRVGTLARPPSPWLKRNGVWLAIAGFFAIVWVERVFHMTSNPPATGLMLLALIAASVAFCMVYQREVWCRHACPLGALASSLAPSAVLEIGANPGVCTSTCTSHSCYRGSDPIPGCTVFHHPLAADEGHLCKLCMDCLRSCPHDSARLFLRPPLVGVWRLRGASAELAPFAVAVCMLALVLHAGRSLPWLATTPGLTVTGLAAIAVGAALSRALPVALHGSGNGDHGSAAQVAFALMVLGWGPLMATQVANIPILSSLHLSFEPKSLGGRLLSGLDLTAAHLAMAAFILFAAALAFITLARIRALAVNRGEALSVATWTTLGALCAGYVVAALIAI